MKRLVLLLLVLASAAAYGQQYPSVLVDIRNDSNAVELDIADLNQTRVDLQFDFPLYGETFKEAWVTYTGVINFQDQVNGGVFCCNGRDFNDQTFSEQLVNGQYDYLDYSIFGMWTDLDVEYNANPWYLSKQNTATFGWYDIPEFGGFTNNLNSFEIKIFDSGDIKFRYDEVNIQHHDTTVGVTGDVSEGEYAQFKFKSRTNGGWVSDVPKVWTFNSQTGVFEDQYGDVTMFQSAIANYIDPCEEDPMSCGIFDPTDSFLGYDDGIYGDDIFDFVDSGQEAFDSYQESMTMGPAAQDFFEKKYEEDPSFFDYTEEPDYGYEEPKFDGQPEDFFGAPPPSEMFGEPTPYEQDIAKELEQMEKEFEKFAEENDLPKESFEEIQETYEKFTPELDEEEFLPPVEDMFANEYFEEEITLIADVMSKNQEELHINEESVDSVYTTEELVQKSVASTRVNSARRVDSVGIAMSQIQTTERTLSTALVAGNVFTNSNTSQDTGLNDVNGDLGTSVSSSTLSDSAFNENIIEDLLNQNSGSSDGSMGDMGQTFSSGNTSFDSDTSFDFSFGSDPTIFVATSTDTGQQTETRQEIIDTSSQGTTTVDQNFDSQTDQAFSSGGSISDALTATAPPDFSRFNVAPPSQQEQQTTQRADAQANNMSDEQLEENLEEFTANMQDSGGFTDQSLTVFLMGRNSSFSQYNNIQLQDNPFYDDRGMAGGSIQNDRRSMLRLVGTDKKHEELVSLQYGR